jgi:hypothetical protein
MNPNRMRPLLLTALLAVLAPIPIARASDDPAFDRYLDVELLERAWSDKNAALLADVGLQLAEGERVLFRSHKNLTSDQVLAMATRAAVERRDAKTLARLTKAAEATNKAELRAQASGALRLASASRDADPALALPADRTSPETFLLVRDALERIVDAKVMGDVESLNILIQLAPKMDAIPEAQRKHLAKTATAARDSLPKDAGIDPAAEAIGKLLDEARSPREGRRSAPIRRTKESTTLGIRYVGALNGLRVTGLAKTGPTPLAKGEKLELGDLIVRVGDVDSAGIQVDLDDLVREAVNVDNRELLVYRPRTATVVTYRLPDMIPGIVNE